MYQKYGRILWLLALLLFVSACGDNNEKKSVEKEEKPIEVKVNTLKKETYPIWIYFTGKTQAINEVDVIARVSGELKGYHFQPGQQVGKDDLLFTIDKSEYQAVWDQKNAILEKDKASYALAQANVKRYTPLVKEQLAPREKLDELTATLKQLEATIKSDEAALKRSKLDLEYCDIKASIDGQIGKPLVLTGNIVSAGTVLSKIVESKKLYVNFNPSAQEVALIKRYGKEEKPEVEVSVRGNEEITETLKGRIDFIDNISNSSTGTVAMRAVVENGKGLIFPGSFVEVKLFLGEYNVLAVHPDQVSQDQEGSYVYVVNDNNEVHAVHFKPFFSNNDLMLVGKSLHEGDRVIVGTISGLTEGMKVTPEEVPSPVNVKK
jgi:RND family efflux transporter MFP subunit